MATVVGPIVESRLVIMYVSHSCLCISQLMEECSGDKSLMEKCFVHKNDTDAQLFCGQFFHTIYKAHCWIFIILVSSFETGFRTSIALFRCWYWLCTSDPSTPCFIVTDVLLWTNKRMNGIHTYELLRLSTTYNLQLSLIGFVFLGLLEMMVALCFCFRLF